MGKNKEEKTLLNNIVSSVEVDSMTPVEPSQTAVETRLI